MSKPTVRDIADTCTGLARVAESLREAAGAPLIEGAKAPLVPVQVAGLLESAQYLETVTAELRELLPAEPVELGGE